MTQHELKIYPEHFQGIISGHKTFEIRKNDRNYQVGDILWLREYYPEDDIYSGESIQCRVSYITDFNMQNDYVCMAIQQCSVDCDMTKPYYTRAADAVWMHDTWGTQFTYHQQSTGYNAPMPDWMIRHVAAYGDNSVKLYVAPDSLDFFKPREGDIVSINIVCDIYGEQEIPIEWSKRDAWEVDHCNKIIQRDGKPIIWPEGI